MKPVQNYTDLMFCTVNPELLVIILYFPNRVKSSQLGHDIPISVRAIPEKKYLGGGGKTAGHIFFMGGWCGKFSNYMGHWCSTTSNYMGGWCFAAWKGKKEYYLPKKERSFI